MGKPRWKKIAERRLPSYRREIPASSLGGDWILDGASRPTNELEALLMTPPGGHEPLLAPNHQTDPYLALEAKLGVSMKLTELERQVLDARVMSGLSYREVAAVVGCSASTAHRVYHEVMARVRKEIERNAEAAFATENDAETRHR